MPCDWLCCWVGSEASLNRSERLLATKCSLLHKDSSWLTMGIKAWRGFEFRQYQNMERKQVMEKKTFFSPKVISRQHCFDSWSIKWFEKKILRHCQFRNFTVFLEAQQKQKGLLFIGAGITIMPITFLPRICFWKRFEKPEARQCRLSSSECSFWPQLLSTARRGLQHKPLLFSRETTWLYLQATCWTTLS